MSLRRFLQLRKSARIRKEYVNNVHYKMRSAEEIVNEMQRCKTEALAAQRKNENEKYTTLIARVNALSWVANVVSD